MSRKGSCDTKPDTTRYLHLKNLVVTPLQLHLTVVVLRYMVHSATLLIRSGWQVDAFCLAGVQVSCDTL